MPYDYDDISMLNDEDIRDLAIEHGIQVPALEGMIPADRHRLIAQLRAKGVNTRSNAQFNITEQIYEYEAMFPDDMAPQELYQVRVPPQTGVRQTTGNIGGDER